MRYRRRLANFRIFRQYLQMPLVAVELAFGPEFELLPRDAEILVQLRDGAMLWQKERLLNLALKALPNGCNKVAWLDCDIIFDRPDWVEAAISLSIEVRSFNCSGRCIISARDGLPEKITHLRWNSHGHLRLYPCRRAFRRRHVSAILSIIE